MIRERPGGQGGARGDAAQLVTGCHSLDGTRRVLWIGISVRAVNGITVLRPAQNRRMRPGRWFFLIEDANASGPRDHHVVAELGAQANRVDVIVIRAGIGLMAQAGIESLGFAISRGAAP